MATSVLTSKVSSMSLEVWPIRNTDKGQRKMKFKDLTNKTESEIIKEAFDIASKPMPNRAELKTIYMSWSEDKSVITVTLYDQRVFVAYVSAWKQTASIYKNDPKKLNRMTVKKFKDRELMHKFLNTKDNALFWRITKSDHPQNSGKFAFAGGQWHNVKHLDPSILAHI